MPTAGIFRYQRPPHQSPTKYLALFVQDDWRVRPNLTLNLGIRFEHEFPNVERYNRALNGFDGTTPSPIAAAAQAAYALKPDLIPAAQFKVLGGPLFAGSGNRAIYSPQSEMFSPRLGFAWTPFGSKTVLRGGGWRLHVPDQQPQLQRGRLQPVHDHVVTTDSYLTPNATLANPFPDGFQQPTGSALGHRHQSRQELQLLQSHHPQSLFRSAGKSACSANCRAAWSWKWPTSATTPSTCC